ncbi:hypothetical protein [Brachybacterium hainanense]|uniref:Uncharacterized protein n=1 Tax=Brachybacterium hainanense TaxID=1541174 RepID=A0ABV6R9W0_9MICO
MIDQLLILAENGSHASEALPPYIVGGGMFIILMCLLGITFLFSGLNQPSARGKGPAAPAQRSGDAAHTSPKH